MNSTAIYSSGTARTGTGASQFDCPACAGSTFREMAVLPAVSCRRCQGCGLLVSRIERTEPSGAEYSRVAEEHYERGLLAVRNRQSSDLLEMIRRHAPGAKTLVDVGCGFGNFLVLGRAAGYSVRGVEPDEAAARRAEAILGEGIVQHGLLTPSTFPSGSADVVTTLDVLEHIPVDIIPAFIATVRQSLRPGGIWVVKVPTSEGPFFRIAHLARHLPLAPVRGILERLWQSRYEFPHTVYFDARSLARLVARSGFRVEQVAYLEEVPSGTARDRLRYDDS